MNGRVSTPARWLLWALPLWALMLALGTLTHQPDPQTQFGSWSRYVTTDQFLASHLANSIVGAAIGSLGFVGLLLYLLGTRSQGRATAAMITMVLGNTITAAVFGVAAVVQPVLGRAFLAGDTAAQGLYNSIYAAPLFASVAIGLLLFIAGGILAGLGVLASERLPHWAGWLLLIATPVFALSNIFLPAVLQTVAAVSLFVATLGIAWYGTRERQTGTAAHHVARA